MAAELVWLEEAESDLQSIFDYISADNIRAAEAYTGSIVEACDRLRGFPLSGRAFDKHYRILVVRNHLVLYRHDQQNAEVVIAAIIDGRRDVAVLLRGLSEPET